MRSTLQDVVDLVMVCGTLGTFPLQPLAVGDTVVAVDNAAQCKRLDLAAAVTGLETPWTGISITPALTITPGGVNGHAPQFAYDLCADLQALPACACVPDPGDLVPIIQGGACVLAQWPTFDLCDQIALLANGALIAGDTVPVREAGGACKQVLASTLSGFDGGPFSNPLLGPDGSCAAPTYSFQSSTDSGMWFDPTTGPSGSVVISDHNCANRIDVGASIDLTSTASSVSINANAGSFAANAQFVSISGTAGIGLTSTGGAITATASVGTVTIFAGGGFLLNASVLADIGLQFGADFRVRSLAGPTDRLRIDGDNGEYQINGSAGAAGEVLTSAGPGLPAVWAPVSASVTFPLLAPTSATPQYSFAAQTGMGMAMDGAQLHFGSLDTVSPVWSVSSRLSIDTGVTGDMFLYGSRGDGSRGANIDIKGGDALNPGIQVEGGGATIRGGNSSQDNGGTVSVLGGNATGVSGTGGNAVINSGNANGGAPGNVLITAGSSNNLGAGNGNIRLRTNHMNSTSPAAITMDHHGSVQYGDPYVFAAQAFAVGTSFWYGVTGDASSGNRGQNIRIWAGQGLNSGAGGDGGDLDLRGGNGTSGPNNDGGQLFLAGGTLSGAGIKGYVQLERVNAAPVAAPNLTAGYAPIVLFDDGANIHLYAWSVGAGAWQDVTLT